MRIDSIRLPLTGMVGLVVALSLFAGACGSEPGEARERTTPEPVAAAPQEDAVSHAAAEVAPPLVIAKGDPVEIRDHLVPGQITLFDFTSKFCPPCRMFEPYIDRLHEVREDLTVVKVDINRPQTRGIDWRSPVMQQYRLGQIPHFKIFDASGNLTAEGDAAKQLVIQWIEEMEAARG
jgi:thiol-disulfide isomerase/thioredoxin